MIYFNLYVLYLGLDIKHYLFWVFGLVVGADLQVTVKPFCDIDYLILLKYWFCLILVRLPVLVERYGGGAGVVFYADALSYCLNLKHQHLSSQLEPQHEKQCV